MGCWKISAVREKKSSKWASGLPREMVQFEMDNEEKSQKSSDTRRTGFRSLPQNSENDSFYERFHHVKNLRKEMNYRTSLVVQCLRTRLPTQETWV